MSKPALKSLCLLLAALLAYYWRIVFTRQFSMLTDYETVSQAYSWFHFWADSIRHGKWPLWDPYMFAGRSFSGEMQTAVFYPLHLMFALFGQDRNGLLPVRLYHGYFVLAHVLAGFCMFALVRELELSYFAAVVGGLCFSVGGFMGQVPWPHLLESAGWTPLLFLLVLRAWKTSKPTRAASYASLAGLVLGLSVLAGGLHIVFMQGILVVAAAIFYGFQQKQQWGRTLAMTALTIAVGLLAGAVQLASSAEYSAHSLRFVGAASAIPATQKIPYATLDAISPRLLLSYLVFSNPQGTLNGIEALDPYIGAFPILLAIIGFWKCRRQPWVRFMAGLIVVAIIYSLGRTTWVYQALYFLVPYLWMAREPTRFLFLAHFGLMILAAFGCDALFSTPQRIADWRSWDRVYVAAAIVSVALLFAPLSSWHKTSLWMILLTYPLFRWIVGGANGAVPRLLTVALIVLNLNIFSFIALNRKYVARTGIDYYERLRSFRGPVEFLRRQPGLFRVRVLTDPGLNMGDAYEMQTLNGGAVTTPANYFYLINQSSGGQRLLNVRYLVRPASANDPNPVYADSTWKIYEDPQAMPRAWVEHAQRAAPEEVRITGYAAEHIALAVHSATQGMLVLSEMYDPGWTARVNGAPAAIAEVYGGLRGIAVPAGDSTVVLEYRPTSALIGAAVSIATFVIVLAFAALALRRQTD